MLFIYGSLGLGGIETFFMRIAKERFQLGLTTSILLMGNPDRNNSKLLMEVEKYAEVIYPNQLFFNILGLARISPLLLPIKRNRLREVLEKTNQIHVYDGMHALLGYRLSRVMGKKLPVTIGFYHYIKYLWGGDRVAWHERVNRKFVFDYLPQQSLLFFSKGNRDLYIKHKKNNFVNANTFRLGVVDKKEVKISGKLNKPLRIVAIGRLVEFKTYNFYMIDVVKSLVVKGYKVQFDIYGDGPLRQQIQGKIEQLGMAEFVHLNGTLDYSKFDETVMQYDLFIGSGTAIIQSSALGVPSIVGVENVIEPKSYGYFGNVSEYEYNLKGLNLPLLSVENLIEELINADEAVRFNLKQCHLESVEMFTNEACQKSMDDLKNIEMPNHPYLYSMFLYEFSRITDTINIKYNKNHPRRTQFEDFRRISED
ncbi:hypothetical protein I6F48_20185 [Pseudoalteromonas sp. SWYJ118]|uniref:glycosyltransferase n=1 Tax=Pseudoalteromonas sp. SWYJ118 TaxID=2792062 RepID=UPI0018CF8A9C|nr:glycosyltransferase [Pseudoalteromonas sp. SWYJ118]MBH0077827.1 hypothetical protein [Pseudoalteromonas sp. SWYJ118]